MTSSQLTGTNPPPATDISQAIDKTMDNIEASLDRIAGRAMGEIITEIDAYSQRNSQPLREQVLANARESLTLFTRLVRENRTASPGDFEFVTRTVTGPLRQGIGVESVLHAYRIGHRNTWDAIIGLTSQLPNGSEVSVALSRPAMEFIDSISIAVTLAFLEESKSLAGEASRESRDLIEAMIAGDLPEPGSKSSIRAVGLITGPAGFVCLRACLAEDSMSGSEKRLAEALAQRTIVRDGLISVRQREVVAFLPLTFGSARESSEVLLGTESQLRAAAGAPIRLGLSLECLGAPEAVRGYREAGEAMRRATGDHPVIALPLTSTFEQLLTHTDETLRRQSHASLGELGKMTGPAADELRRTVLAYAEQDMNARATAKVLFCHPNTVHHRLDRIRELSSLDPTRFLDLIELVSALKIRER